MSALSKAQVRRVWAEIGPGPLLLAPQPCGALDAYTSRGEGASFVRFRPHGKGWRYAGTFVPVEAVRHGS